MRREGPRWSHPLSLHSAGAFAPQNAHRGLDNDPQVQPNRPVSNVLAIHVEHVLETGFASSASLPEAGQARNDIEPLRVGSGIDLSQQEAISYLKRPWANQAHVTTQHVPELGKLIEAGPSKDASDGGDPGILLHLEQHATI